MRLSLLPALSIFAYCTIASAGNQGRNGVYTAGLSVDRPIGVIVLPDGASSDRTTSIEVQLPPCDVQIQRSILIFDVNSQLIYRENAFHSVPAYSWNGRNLAGQRVRPGVYFYTARSTGFQSPYTQPPDTLHRFLDSTEQKLPQYLTPDWNVAMGDLTGDSKEDYIVVINEGLGGSQPRLFINDGAGNFADETLARIPSVEVFATQALFLDVDADNDTDIYLVATDDDSTGESLGADQLWLNDGDGYFTDVTGSHLPSNRGLVLAATSADLNGDNLVDLLLHGTVDFMSPSLRLLYNTGMGVFADSTGAYFPSDTLTFSLAIASFDATSTGRNDILLIGGTNSLVFYRNTGSGFVSEDFRFPSLSSFFRGTLITDFTKDGYGDVFLFGIFGQPNVLLINDGNGFFADESATRLPSFPSAHTNLGVVLDVQADGNKDIFLPTVQPGGNDHDRLLLDDGTGFFTDGSSLLPDNLDFSVAAVAAGINSDAWDDILVANNVGVFGDPPQQDRLYINAEVITSVERPGQPWAFTLEQNYPNPFNPTTTFSFSIPYFSFTILSVYDLLSREVATLVNEKLGPGTYTRQWDASGMASGVYLYRLNTGNVFQTRRMVLLR